MENQNKSFLHGYTRLKDFSYDCHHICAYISNLLYGLDSERLTVFEVLGTVCLNDQALGTGSLGTATVEMCTVMQSYLCEEATE